MTDRLMQMTGHSIFFMPTCRYEHWNKYFKEISAVDSIVVLCPVLLPACGSLPCVTYSKVTTAISKMKDCGVASADDIPSSGK